MSREELYRNVFKTAPPPLPSNFTVSLLVDNKPNGKLKITFSKDRSILFFQSAAVLVILKDIVKEEVFQNLKTKVDSAQRLSNHQLEESGFQVRFVAAKFQLSIDIPSELRGTQVHRLRGQQSKVTNLGALRPKPFSGYLNMSARQGLNYHQISDAIANRQASVLNLEGALNYKGLVLEGTFFYREASKPSFSRSDFRLVYDQPQKALRYALGDLYHPIVGYQSVVNMGGISLSKDFSLLQPSLNAFPVRDYEFFLKNPSQVEIWINGSLSRSLQLDPGMHDIQDFPFSSGENEVEIKITDPSGQDQFLNFSFIQERMLLAPGKDQYSFNLGFRRFIQHSRYHYNTKDPVSSLFYQRGITNKLTLGGYSQLRLKQSLIGLEGLYATSPGKIQFTGAMSLIDGIGADFAGKIVFTHLPKTRANAFSISSRSQLEYFGVHFGKMDDLNPYNKELLRMTHTLSMPISNKLGFSIRGGYSILREPNTGNTYNISVSLKKTWLRQIRTYISYQQNNSYNGKLQSKITAGLSWSIPVKKQSIRINKSTTGDLTVNWQNNSYASTPGKVRASASASLAAERSRYRGRMGYEGNQGAVELSHTSTIAHKSGQQTAIETQHQSVLTVKSALVFAGNSLALSRHVSNGFVLVKGIKNLKNKAIVINPSSNGYQAISKSFRPAVLNYLPAYRSKTLRILPLSPPMGYVPSKTAYTLFPSYKCGYEISMGADATVVVIGNLVDKYKHPIASQVIKTISLDHPQADLMMTFTNSKGKFQITNLTPGRYKITGNKSNRKWEIPFEIPDNIEGLYRIGELSEVDSSFHVQDLPSSSDTARIDSVHLRKLDKVRTSTILPFKIKTTEDVDYVDGLELVLQNIDHDTSATVMAVKEEKMLASKHKDVKENEACLIQVAECKLKSKAIAVRDHIRSKFGSSVVIVHEGLNFKIFISGFEDCEESRLFLPKLALEGYSDALLVSVKEYVQTINPESYQVSGDELIDRGLFAVQVGAFGKQSNALALQARLDAIYNQTTAVEFEDGLYKVRFLYFNGRKNARNFVSVLLGQGFSDIYIVPVFRQLSF
ncbi:MAG: SPOR domain-containing protein [Labilibaculum antarcticum]